MKILLIEPFMSGSHQSWALGLQKYSSHHIEILSLPGRHWKWRMHGGAITLAKEFLDSNFIPDLILATDMLDLTTFLAMTRVKTAQTPVIMYFHENQLTYPWSPQDRDIHAKRDHHYSFINYRSALVADQVLFNSHYHQNSFFEALQRFLKMFPDHRELNNVDLIKNKSRVLYLGLELPEISSSSRQSTILWNHRWEYDKNPEEFYQLLLALKSQHLSFKLNILGERYVRYPAVFDQIKEEFSEDLTHWGYAESKSEYWGLLEQSTLLPVTSNQDFFGISIVEAISAGVVPLLPKRLTYPELLPNSEFLYQSLADLTEKTRQYLSKPYRPPLELMAHARSFNWSQCIETYDELFEGFYKRS